eukprot:2722600-Rhodomonas_salina.5
MSYRIAVLTYYAIFVLTQHMLRVHFVLTLRMLLPAAVQVNRALALDYVVPEEDEENPREYKVPTPLSATRLLRDVSDDTNSAICYARGTDAAYGATPPVVLRCVLRACYAVPGTELRYVLQRPFDPHLNLMYRKLSMKMSLYSAPDREEVSFPLHLPYLPYLSYYPYLPYLHRVFLLYLACISAAFDPSFVAGERNPSFSAGESDPSF